MVVNIYKQPSMTQTTKTLVAFATRWGPQFGGINSFNADLLPAFSAAFYNHAKTVCVVLHASVAEQKAALGEDVHLVQLGLADEKAFSVHLENLVWQALQAAGIHIQANETVWLGHDRITGAIALAAAKERGGKSALIHHMSYALYESYAENSAAADAKKTEQEQLFKQADILLAVGPLLRDALADLLPDRTIDMLVPGLPEIPTRATSPKTFKAFISGRLSDDARKIKQAHLGVAAFGEAISRCSTNTGLPDALRGENQPQLFLRGVDFENSEGGIAPKQAEDELKLFAERYAGRAFGLTALPFTTDRDKLFTDLSGASVAMMPSWHEGFGLVAWEAIAAGVPLIVSKKSGVYRLLKELKDGLYTSWVTDIDVLGTSAEPYFKPEDLDALAKALIAIAHDQTKAKNKAASLREALSSQYSRAASAHQLANAFRWNFPQPQTQTLVASPPHASLAAAPLNAAPKLAPTSTLHRLLELPAPTWKLVLGLSDSQLLRAEEAVIPFDPSGEAFLQTQLDWANSSNYPLAVRLLTGQGGSGKTRLALELCQRLQMQGWQTGFLRSECDANKAAALGRLIWDAQQNFCIVLDYAETRQPVLLELLKTVLAYRQPAQAHVQVRVLLLARDSGDWWAMLPNKKAACESLLEGKASSGPFVMPPLHDSEASRHGAYQLALHTFAERLSIIPPENQPSLIEPHFALPLYIQMAALLALRGERPKSAESLARALVSHERRYWRKAVTALGGVGTEREQQAALLMTLSTLCNGIASDRDIEPLWRSIDLEKGRLKSLFRTLTPLYPDRQGLLGLRPDLLGEALVAQTLLSSHGANLLNAVLSNNNAPMRHASLTVLARLLRYRPDLAAMLEEAIFLNLPACASELIAVCIETPSPLPTLVESAFKRLPKPKRWQIAGAVGKQVEFNVLPLLGLRVLICQDGLDKAWQKLNPFKLQTRADYAAALINHSVALDYNGEDEAALKSSKQAVNAYQELTNIKPERFEPDLATALNNHANYLATHRQHDEALITAKQALDMRQRLAEKDHIHFEFPWANSMLNYANHLGENGQHAEALATAKKAIDLHQKLAMKNPERFEPNWALSLNNYANRLADNDRHHDALATCKQALDLYQKLYNNKPERFEPDLAHSLDTYASHLIEQGLYNEALAANEQALTLRETQAKTKPERFDPDWAMALSNHAHHLCNQGRYTEALTAAQQALDIYQQLAEAKSERHMYNYQNARLSLALWQWLTTQTTLHESLAVPLPKIGVPTEARALAFQQATLSAFAQATTDQSPSAIHAVFQCWAELDQAQKNRFKDNYLLLAALAEHQLGANAAPAGWRSEMARYRERKQGRLPMWMTEVAHRLGIEL